MEKKFQFFRKLLFLTLLMLGMGTAFADGEKCAANTIWGEFKTEIADLVNGYYQIDSPEKLAWFACETSKGSYTIKAKLTQSIDLEHKLFMPIAAGPGSNGDTGFKGEFDGQGFKISNLYINASEIAKPEFGGQKNYAQNVGFVAVMGVNATVKNITLENVDIQASTNAGEAIDGQEHQISVGAVVGWMAEKNNILVENCMVSGIIKTTGNKQGVGGIVGNAKKGTITNCLSLVEIQASGSQADIGGIIGITKTNVTVSSCVYAGPGLTNTGSNGSVGGIAGNVISGTLTTEGDYYEGQSLDGVGNYCAECHLNGVDANPDNNIQQVTLSNIEEVTCELNGKNTDGTCKTEPWAVGETSLSLNGYGTDGYKIVFDANGGAFVDDAITKNKFLDAGMTITDDEIGKPTREDYTFMGWALTQNATEPAENLGTVAKALTIYAVWEPVCTITFNVAPGSFPSEGSPAIKTKKVNKGDVITVEGLGALPTFYCEEDGKTEDDCAVGKGHYFTGWQLISGEKVKLEELTATGDLELRAVWETVKTYTVTYNANEHGVTTVSFVRVGDNETVSQPTDPIADLGYVFDGNWYTEATCQNKFVFNEKIDHSYVLYAKWTPKQYKITYEMNGMSSAGDNPVSYTIETPTFSLAAPADVEGYVFNGWFYDANFTNPASQVIQGTTGDVTFYAKWSTKTYRIRYLADNNSQGGVSDQFKEHGKSLVLESDGHFSRTGYSQDGWSLTDGGERVYALGASYSANADINLYPHWVQGLEVEHYGAVTVYKYTNETVAEINGEYTGADAVYIPDPIEVDNIVINRTFTANTPSTIMLPFTLPEGTNLNGAKFYYLKSVAQIEGKYTWKATMQWIGSGKLPEANKPYGIICPSSTLEFNLGGGKARLQTAQQVGSDKVYYEVSGGNWHFVGTYAYNQWEETDEDFELAYALAGTAGKGLRAGDFGKVTYENWTYPLRSYMRKKDNTVQLQPLPQAVRARGASYGLNNIGSEIIEVEFVDDKKTTAIGHMNTVTGEIKIDRWFDLKGRRVKNVNRAAKGAYYGKKVFHE